MRASALSSRHETKRGRQPMAKTPYREKLKALRERAGVTQAEAAKALNFAYASGYRYYEDPAKIGDRPIPDDIVRRLSSILLGRGEPAVTQAELSELTERSAVPVKAKATDERGFLIVRYRIEPGTFVRLGTISRMLGASKVCPSADYEVAKQYVAIDVNGDQLHCVEDVTPITDKRCLLAVPYDDTELFEVVVARVSEHKGQRTFVGWDGMPVEGNVLGVVIGSYVKE